MSFPKIALRGSPTTIKQLESLGGYNSAECKGFNTDYYYFINDSGRIVLGPYLKIPEGYKLISHISELKYNKLFKLL